MATRRTSPDPLLEHCPGDAMKNWLRPGQMVVCVQAPPRCCIGPSGRLDLYTGPSPIKGCVYTVASVEPYLASAYLWLTELNSGVAWNARYFRPVRPTSLACLTHLLAPSDAMEPA